MVVYVCTIRFCQFENFHLEYELVRKKKREMKKLVSTFSKNILNTVPNQYNAIQVSC